MAYEGSRQMGFMRRLFELRPWYKLVPDQSVIAAGQGEGEDHVRAARAEDGSFVIAYLPSGKPVNIKMDKVSSKTVKAHWYDPRKGTWLSIGEYANTGSRQFTAPSRGEKDDWVLVLEDAAKGYRTARTALPQLRVSGNRTYVIEPPVNRRVHVVEATPQGPARRGDLPCNRIKSYGHFHPYVSAKTGGGQHQIAQ
jgi:hypothetical protein